MALGGLLIRLPVALSVDATMTDCSAISAWRRTDQVAVLKRGPSRTAEARASTRAALVLAWTAWAKRGVERVAPVSRVVEHHPGVDPEAYAPSTRRPRDLLRILFVGGRFADKGGDDLLAALGDDLGRTVEVDVVTPADVAARPGLRVHRLGPADPELRDLRQQADVFCLPSKADAAPWVVLEAMACGVPVVGTNVAGIPDLVGNGACGLLVGAGDPRSLREALLALLEDPARRAALGAAARQRCEERYDASIGGPLVGILAALRGPS